MDFELTEEQQMLREVSRSMLSAHAPSSLVRAAADSGQDLDAKLWTRGAELGWTGLMVPEENGGAEQGLVEMSLVAEELGRAGTPGPWWETALVARALAASGHEAAATLLPGLVEGAQRASWASDVQISAVPDGERWLMSGTAPAVHAAGSVDLIALIVSTPHGRALAVIDSAAATLRRRTDIDQTRGWYHLALDAVPVPAERIVSTDQTLLSWLEDAAMTLTAADALGVGERLLEMTVEHAGVREQFGRPLGAFQSVKHKAADMLTVTKGVRAATYYAAMALDADAEDGSLSARIAKAFAGEEISRIAGEALQTLGGIGFTWEHDLHLFLRRAKVDELVGGSPSALHQQIYALIT